MNPWTGINAWKEFKYDARHPKQFLRRAWDGLMGRNPKTRRIMPMCWLILLFGVGQVVCGIVLLAR